MVPVSSDDYLLSLGAVRERCFKVQEAATRNQLHHFEVDEAKLKDVIQIIVSLIRRDFDTPADIPAHGRWRHFDAGNRPRIQNLISAWASLGQDRLEQTRRTLDLMSVACLLDLEAGNQWSYREKTTNLFYKRCEGIAVATLDLFIQGFFSSDPSDPHRVDSEALLALTLDKLTEGYQVTEKNILVGLEDRLGLLQHLGLTLQRRQDYFGSTVPRPGNLMDFLLGHATTIQTQKGPLIHLETLWPIVMEMGEYWAAEPGLGGTPGLGDVWPCETIRYSDEPTDKDHYVAFHRLSQWLVYSLIEPMSRLLGATIEGTDLLTPLPDYRNAGLLMDTGFLTLKKKDLDRGLQNYRRNSLLPGQPKVEIAPMFDMSDPVVIEWRALTVAYLDLIAERVREALKLSRKDLTLTQFIEGGSWNAGRELAEISRPNTQEPPIVIKIGDRVIY
ncbi:DUF1688-domain-containing protein [Hesseltinella vesiculosa]|uniref:DUF1688-domain-containing protein n=1 Tax=Hesseltinella vesiculosa TaxID=101127 RepID=A0A1X2GDX1_9FUNG|nr:DUF1688-domain-containing protein [Hesseltinella vesiculosa]